MKALNRAVTLLSAANNQIPTGTVETIDPGFIVIHAWNKGRLEESKRIIQQKFQKETEFIPGIHAVYVLGLPPYYLTNDGEAHDVVAARLLGINEIRVKIQGYCHAHPNRLLIEDSRVYFWAAEYEHWRAFGAESDDTIKILEALGVESKQTVMGRLKRIFTHSD